MNEALEKQLQALVQANQPENRSQWAEQWKEKGGKVVGVITSYVPEEVIHAAGCLPWGVSGTWQDATPKASVYRPSFACLYCTHVLESVLSGELDFMAGLVTTQRDDDVKRLWDVLYYLGKPPFNHIMYLPHTRNEITLEMWKESLLDLKQVLERWTGEMITDEKLQKSIELYNETRLLLTELYALRKREVPPLSGAEYLGITTAARIMPKEAFNAELKSLLPYIKEREAGTMKQNPRLLLISEFLDNPAYVQLVEEAGALVAMDDMDVGSKYFRGEVLDDGGDLWSSLAERYMTGPEDSRMENWDDQIEQLLQWCKEYHIDGVLELRQLYSFPADFRFSFLRKHLEKEGIPFMSLNREYHLAHAGMLKTRVEAFIEMF